MTERSCHFEVVDVSLLNITNLSLDEDRINAIAEKLKSGKYLGMLYIYYSDDEGYCVNDGNHRALAMKKEGYKKALCEVYTAEQ